MTTRRKYRTRTAHHPNAPKRLIRDHSRLKSLRAIAAEKHVNVRYVHDLMVHGIVPSNPSIATRLYCKPVPLSKLKEGDARRRHIRWWHHLTRDQRNDLILILFHYRDSPRRLAPRR